MPIFLRIIAALALIAITGCHKTHTDPNLKSTTREGRLAPELKNLGSYKRVISTASEEAQRFFTQGLILLYGFNHAEALRSFQEGARLDPKCGLMYWGQALALAPNINDSAIGPDREAQGHAAIEKALLNREGLSPVERGLVDALAARFTANPKPDRAQLNRDYAAAMAKLHLSFPDDVDVATLYADAFMNTMPWDYWTKDGKPKPGMQPAVDALERALRLNSQHPGANHFYIHAVEASTDPDRAIPSAERLGALVPGAGHLVHMPSHIFIRVGRYSDGTEANYRAIKADEDYITQCRAQGIYPAAYYPHNIHFLFATLAMEGRSKETLEAAGKVATRHEHGDLKEPGFGFAHLLRSIPYLAQVRFGRWDDILAAKDPGEDYPFVAAMWRFARGMAFAGRGDLKAARAEAAHLARLAAHPSLPELKVFDLNSLDKLAAIGRNLLDGELALKEQRRPAALAALRKAVELEDALLYSEPPDWPLQPRHYLGAALLETGDFVAAQEAFLADLRRHRENGWALRGLVLSLEAQGRKREAVEVAVRFDKAWKRADVILPSSRF